MKGLYPLTQGGKGGCLRGSRGLYKGVDTVTQGGAYGCSTTWRGLVKGGKRGKNTAVINIRTIHLCFISGAATIPLLPRIIHYINKTFAKKDL